MSNPLTPQIVDKVKGEKIMEDYKPAICQYCLADSNYTRLCEDKNHRCPVCGSDYSGPRRDKEFRILVENGLVADDEEVEL